MVDALIDDAILNFQLCSKGVAAGSSWLPAILRSFWNPPLANLPCKLIFPE
jgi:hypothetical protein